MAITETGYYSKGYYGNGYCVILRTVTAKPKASARGHGGAPTDADLRASPARTRRDPGVDFELTIATIEGVGALLVSVEGDLEISTAERVTAATDVAVRAGCPLILDLSGCPFIDSTGLRSVLHAHKALTD
jgi:hypothetical protein